MIHFNSVACQHAFMEAVKASPQLLEKCFQLLDRKKPCSLYLHLGRSDDAGKYFDFGVFSTPVNMVLIGDEYRPDLTSVPVFTGRPEHLVVNGGLVNRDGVWSAHT